MDLAGVHRIVTKAGENPDLDGLVASLPGERERLLKGGVAFTSWNVWRYDRSSPPTSVTPIPGL